MASPRLKREECVRTQHDSVFSKWEILIGPSDWKDHSSGKDGVDRYRIHNIPNSTSRPGLYELAIAALPTDDAREFRKYDSRNIIAVYLGQAENVRTRLQQYGRGGAHLERGNLIAFLDTNESSSLFKEIFSRGYSVLFRWAPMIDKKEAEKIEAELLRVFDYAWNRRGNGACRHDEIFSKLNYKATSPLNTVLIRLQPWKHPIFSKKEGIKIDSSVPLDNQKGFLLPTILKFGRSHFQFVRRYDSYLEDHDICGVAIPDGSVCRNRPIFGRKRCEEHKGKKIIGTGSVKSSGVIASQENASPCGVLLEDGSVCVELPSYGRKRCELHKGRRATGPGFRFTPHCELFDRNETTVLKSQYQSIQGAVKHEEEFVICGVVYSDGSVCRNRPHVGRKRCERHKGQRITASKLTSTEGSETRKSMHSFGEDDICGVVTGDGCVCKTKPVRGRKRCEEHKGQRIIAAKLPTRSVEGWETKRSTYSFGEEDNICGVVTGEGCVCRRKPVFGRKRCEEHKGRRTTALLSEAKIKISEEQVSSYICGVRLANGSVCRKLPVQGRKRCELHKAQTDHPLREVSLNKVSATMVKETENDSEFLPNPKTGRALFVQRFLS